MSKQIKTRDLVTEGRNIQEKFKKRLDEGFFDNLAKKIGLNQPAKPGFDYAAAMKKAAAQTAQDAEIKRGDIDNVEKELQSKGSSSDLLKKQDSDEGQSVQKAAILKMLLEKGIPSKSGVGDKPTEENIVVGNGDGWEFHGKMYVKDAIQNHASWNQSFLPGLTFIEQVDWDDRGYDPVEDLKKIKNWPKINYMVIRPPFDTDYFSDDSKKNNYKSAVASLCDAKVVFANPRK